MQPYSKSEDARARAAFYTQALGGEILSVTTHGEISNDPANKDKVVHLSLVAGGMPIFMSEYRPRAADEGQHRRPRGRIRHRCGNPDRLRPSRTRRRGAAPAGTGFWGAMFGELKDMYGVFWMLATDTGADRA